MIRFRLIRLTMSHADIVLRRHADATMLLPRRYCRRADACRCRALRRLILPPDA